MKNIFDDNTITEGATEHLVVNVKTAILKVQFTHVVLLMKSRGYAPVIFKWAEVRLNVCKFMYK